MDFASDDTSMDYLPPIPPAPNMDDFIHINDVIERDRLYANFRANHAHLHDLLVRGLARQAAAAAEEYNAQVRELSLHSVVPSPQAPASAPVTTVRFDTGHPQIQRTISAPAVTTHLV